MKWILGTCDEYCIGMYQQGRDTSEKGYRHLQCLKRLAWKQVRRHNLRLPSENRQKLGTRPLNDIWRPRTLVNEATCRRQCELERPISVSVFRAIRRDIQYLN